MASRTAASACPLQSQQYNGMHRYDQTARISSTTNTPNGSKSRQTLCAPSKHSLMLGALLVAIRKSDIAQCTKACMYSHEGLPIGTQSHHSAKLTSSCFDFLLLPDRSQPIFGKQLSSLGPQILLKRVISCSSCSLPRLPRITPKQSTISSKTSTLRQRWSTAPDTARDSPLNIALSHSLLNVLADDCLRVRG